MTLEQTLKLIFERKLKNVLRLSVPLPWLVVLFTVGIAWLTTFFMRSIFSLLGDLGSPLKLWLAYALGFTLIIFTLILTLVRSLSLRGLANESFAALPIATGVWARACSRYFYVSQAPLAAGVFVASVFSFHARSHIAWEQTLGLAGLIAVGVCVMLMAAYSITVWALARNNSWLSLGGTIIYIVLSGATAYLLYRLCTSHEFGSQFWLPALLLTGVICLVFGAVAVLASLLAKPYTAAPLTLAEDTISTNNASQMPQRIRLRGLVEIMASITLRDKKFWLVSGANVLLTALVCLLGLKAHSAQTNAFFISFMPTLLILGQASIVAEIRGQAGGVRESLYALPISSRQIVVAQLAASFAFIAGLVVPVMLLLSLILSRSMAGVPTLHWLLTSLLAALVASFTGVLFFESRRDASRGILAGIVLFLLLLPVLAFDGWLQDKPVMAAVGLAAALAIGLFKVTVWLERKLLLGGK